MAKHIYGANNLGESNRLPGSKSRMTLLMLCMLGAFLLVQEVNSNSCNLSICSSVVSKCLLTSSCRCNFQKDCSCCKKCANCLGYLFTKCCSCVNMCPGSVASKQSSVQDLNSYNQLFQALTEESAVLDKWKSIVFPLDLSILLNPKPEIKLNCTVAYWSSCMSWDNCKDNCQSMGASSVRWFHDGCCECVGENCNNYGINKSLCLQCSKNASTALNEFILLDYGYDYYSYISENND